MEGFRVIPGPWGLASPWRLQSDTRASVTETGGLRAKKEVDVVNSPKPDTEKKRSKVWISGPEELAGV